MRSGGVGADFCTGDAGDFIFDPCGVCFMFRHSESRDFFRILMLVFVAALEVSWIVCLVLFSAPFRTAPPSCWKMLLTFT